MQKVIEFLTKKPAGFFLLAAMFWLGAMCYLNSRDVGVNGFSWHDLLVEANGMVFDLLVFGVLLSIYEALREKREKIERLHEEIDDYRGWDEKEATFRIVGAVKRLNKLGVSAIDLSFCFLERADFRTVNLQGANLKGATLNNANFENANLRKANFHSAYLENVIMWDADLQEANLESARLMGAHFDNAKIQNARFVKALLMGATFWKANLKSANFHRANLKSATLKEANLEGAILTWTNLQDADFIDAKLEGALAPQNWQGQLTLWNVAGGEEILQKYQKDREGYLRIKESIDPQTD